MIKNFTFLLILLITSCSPKYGCPGALRTYSLIKAKPDMRVGWVLTFVSDGDTVVRESRLRYKLGNSYILN